jgi:hypothetical protein
METIVVYSAVQSTRLKYVLDWLLNERLQLGYCITTEEAGLPPGGIAYGKIIAGCISIPDTGLLWKKGMEPIEPGKGIWGELPTVFPAPMPGYTLPFDLFSAIFYLLSRYEEYQPIKPDKHGRYPATESILYKNGWLQRPIVDEWVAALRREIQEAAGIALPAPQFVFQPTYDIDMAYSHLHKGAKRIVGAYLRALLKMDVGQISERTQVLKNRQKDPYDSFRWLRQLHREYDCKPVYFVLAAFAATAFDKNIPPQHPAMIRVIKNIARDGTVGTHPSYYSDEHEKAAREKKALEHITGTVITSSRQHYIRVKTPATYRLLLRNGIAHDYSMGYGAHLGFRAGTGSSFPWYDLAAGEITTLRIHPFCFMDTTAHFELGLPPSDAMAQLDAMSRILERTGSTLITIFHNFSLGAASEWKGWRSAYEHFLGEKAKM